MSLRQAQQRGEHAEIWAGMDHLIALGDSLRRGVGVIGIGLPKAAQHRLLVIVPAGDTVGGVRSKWGQKQRESVAAAVRRTTPIRPDIARLGTPRVNASTCMHTTQAA